jgi:uncharacterized protein (TIGR02145 family)
VFCALYRRIIRLFVWWTIFYYQTSRIWEKMEINMTKSIIQLVIAVLLIAPHGLWGQVVVGGTIPDPSATLDVQSSSQGVLLPRLTATERDAIISPATSLVIFNTTSNCLEINLGTPAASDWVRMKCRSEVVSMLDCSSAVVSGSLIVGTSASGVSADVPYTGGNGAVYDTRAVTSTGVTGLTATLSAGNLASGPGTLTYTITGTPSGAGTASFALSIGGQSCSLDVTVFVPGSITTLDCGTAGTTGTLISGQSATGVSTSVPYTGGNGGAYSGQAVASTGVTGLTATLNAGNLASGPGTLTYTISGTPSSGGTASFALSIGGQACSLDVTVSSTPVCRAKVTATDYKEFMCYNLGAANTSADPFTPSWEINGGYWQWGRPTEAAAGPTGPGTGDTNEGAISGWNNTNAANGSWDDGSKTANDPCPTGYRVPTTAQWDGVLAQNTKTNVGTFSKSATNYGAGKKFGDNLMLPAAGFRDNVNGTLVVRGSTGYYFSSTELSTNFAFHLYFDGGGAYKNGNYRSNGLSVRCIAE